MSVEINDQQVYCFAVLPEQFQPAITDLPTPKSYKKALESTERDDWMKACDKEMKSLNDKNLWVLVDRPSHKKVLRGFWIFRIKSVPHSLEKKFKSRFVVMGNLQEEGVDYHDTFSPTGKPSSL